MTLDEGQPPPLWLVLRYLLTAFDDGEQRQHRGPRAARRGMRVLQDLNFFSLDGLPASPTVPRSATTRSP